MSYSTFRPSAHGWPFSNGSVVGTPVRLGLLPVGKVIGGLCGGMCLTAWRSWDNGTELSTDRAIALREIFRAQLASFYFPRAPLTYLRLQRPGARRARSAAIARSWEHIGTSLAGGRPVLLALVCTLSADPRALSRHHVVLAYGITGDEVAVYDPNHPQRDDVTLRLGDHDVVHSQGRPVFGVFVLSVH